MAALRVSLKCSRTNVYAPLLNQLDALPSTIWQAFEATLVYFYNSRFHYLFGFVSYFGFRAINRNLRCEIPVICGGILEHLAQSVNQFRSNSNLSLHF